VAVGERQFEADDLGRRAAAVDGVSSPSASGGSALSSDVWGVCSSCAACTANGVSISASESAACADVSGEAITHRTVAHVFTDREA
jgi:hypothetical protein